MAERKPLSLNERANRLLEDLSRSRPAKGPPPPEEFRARKVPIEGRRRLCKLSAEKPPEDEVVDKSLLDDSPPVCEKDPGDVEHIRDILNDLTARLECLSVERPSKAVEAGEQEEFGSANSSLLSDGPDVCNGEEVDNGEEEGKGAEKFVVVESDDETVGTGGQVAENDDKVAGDSGGDRNRVVDVSDDECDCGSEGDPIEMSGSASCKGLMYMLPARIAKILYPHQREGLIWLWSLHCGMTGGILGDDMGLGKTMQISAFLAGLFHSGLMKRALIVAPKTLLAHWIKELTIVGISEKIKDYYGTNAKLRNFELDCVLKEGGVLLTTYDIVRNNFKWIRGDFFASHDDTEEEIRWDYVILDEGHIIKNPSTQRAQSLLEIPSSHRIIISGTPIQNNLKELWALFNFCCPDILGDKKEFKEKYEYKILRGNDKNASDRDKYVGSSVAKQLRERIKPYFLRRLKSEVFSESDGTKDVKLSKKTELIVWLRLSQHQRKLYEAFLNSELVHSSVNGSPLAALTILKKICDHPLLLTKRATEEVLDGMDTMLNREDIGMVEDMAERLGNLTHFMEDHEMETSSCKISFVLSLLENLVSDGHNVLIFSQTRKMLNFIQDAITFEGYTFLRIDGTTKIADREKIVHDFQAGSAPILLLTSRVGGLGLTLTNADRVIVVDPAWNPSMDNQSVDRAYRIGQKKDVLVYRLMTCGTIEEKIYKMQVFKGGLFKIATEKKEQTRYFSQRDLQELFSLPKQGFDISLTQQELHEEHGPHKEMESSLVQHISFLERQGIAGVSHHSLLFSKTATIPVVKDETEEHSWKGNRVIRNWTSGAVSELPTLAAEHAMNPQLVKTRVRMTSGGASPVEVEDNAKEIEEMISRLSRTLSNSAVVSKLPDKGNRITKRIAELNEELCKIRESAQKATSKEAEIVEIDDDIASELGKGFASLNI